MVRDQKESKGYTLSKALKRGSFLVFSTRKIFLVKIQVDLYLSYLQFIFMIK